MQVGVSTWYGESQESPSLGYGFLMDITGAFVLDVDGNKIEVLL